MAEGGELEMDDFPVVDEPDDFSVVDEPDDFIGVDEPDDEAYQDEFWLDDFDDVDNDYADADYSHLAVDTIRKTPRLYPRDAEAAPTRPPVGGLGITPKSYTMRMNDMGAIDEYFINKGVHKPICTEYNDFKIDQDGKLILKMKGVKKMCINERRGDAILTQIF